MYCVGTAFYTLDMFWFVSVMLSSIKWYTFYFIKNFLGVNIGNIFTMGEPRVQRGMWSYILQDIIKQSDNWVLTHSLCINFQQLKNINSRYCLYLHMLTGAPIPMDVLAVDRFSRMIVLLLKRDSGRSMAGSWFLWQVLAESVFIFMHS